jgi:cation:H+ antiporter
MLGNAFEVIVGLLLLIWGADRFVHGAAATARNLGVAPLLIGLTIVALATSAPEILVSLVAALQGEPDLAVGNAIGSNIANIGLVLGIVTILRPVELKSATLRREMPALPTDPLQAEFDAEIPKHMSMRVALFWLLVGVATLLLGAKLMVDGAVDIAAALGVSEVVIGITMVAIATSIPELAVSAVSAFRGEYGLAIGNIVGSNIFNLLAVIGVAASIQPAALPPSVLSLHLFVMVAFTLVLFAMTYEYEGRGQITRLEGVALISAYIAYQAYVVVQNV